jgi:serine/threonine protein kinase
MTLLLKKEELPLQHSTNTTTSLNPHCFNLVDLRASTEEIDTSIDLNDVFIQEASTCLVHETTKIDVRANLPLLEVPSESIKVLAPLGRGGFASVYLVKILKGQLASACPEYAMKELRSCQKNSDIKCESNHHSYNAVGDIGMHDLVNEAKVLSKLSHNNIIALLGSSRGLISYHENSDVVKPPFLILEALKETLDKRILRYRKEESKLSPLSRWTAKKKKQRLSMRLETSVMGIVKGMIYLQQQGIVHLDLKPGNIGFLADGTVKIFDFGFASRVETADCSGLCGGNEGHIGTPRYDAVGRHQ